ncbi:unnamed protein product [Cercopithifilaria johnstoni]|uniref:Uncharacterized protein n=1 Tax=Cercopithifilaria johnstoni TaxID=2874296 RepID=A0A8J2PZ35_9BILA|nr:unnamed protein product [Cercopithifilaria johnstoni]
MTAIFAVCCGRHKDEQTKIIEKQLQKEAKHLRRQVKILLLGSGESGKSTFIKQMVIINGRGEFTADEVRAYRQQIYQISNLMNFKLGYTSKLYKLEVLCIKIRP